jgi:hypothetical protein
MSVKVLLCFFVAFDILAFCGMVSAIRRCSV